MIVIIIIIIIISIVIILVLGNRMKMERLDNEYGENGGSDCKAIRNAGKTTKRENPWLNSLMVFCSNVSVLGLSYVANPYASAFRRSVWMLLILVGAGFTTYQIQERIRYYLDHPVNVIIRAEYSEEMVFPTVTMCNENRASLSKTTSLGMYQHCVVIFSNGY